MIFADNCYLFVEYKAQMLKIIGDDIKKFEQEKPGMEGRRNGIDFLGP